MSMITVRVRRAASISRCLIFNSRGGIISRSRRLLIQRVFTPMELRTSMMRWTSSMRARCFRVVFSVLRRLAQSSPTAAFLDVLMVMLPVSSLPPLMR